MVTIILYNISGTIIKIRVIWGSKLFVAKLGDNRFILDKQGKYLKYLAIYTCLGIVRCLQFLWFIFFEIKIDIAKCYNICIYISH